MESKQIQLNESLIPATKDGDSTKVLALAADSEHVELRLCKAWGVRNEEHIMAKNLPNFILLIESGATYPPEGGFRDSEFNAYAHAFAGTTLPIKRFGECWKNLFLRESILTGVQLTEENLENLLKTTNRTLKSNRF